MIRVSVTPDGNLAVIATEIRASLDSSKLLQAVGKAVQRKVQESIRSYGASHPNKLGGPSTGYYERAASKTTLSVSANVATVNTSHIGIRLRIYGGEVVPKRGRYLAIPVDAQAHGRSPRDMNLVPVIRYFAGQRRMVALARQDGKRMFAMKERVRQIGDTRIVPSQSEIQAVIDEAVKYTLP